MDVSRAKAGDTLWKATWDSKHSWHSGYEIVVQKVGRKYLYAGKCKFERATGREVSGWYAVWLSERDYEVQRKTEKEWQKFRVDVYSRTSLKHISLAAIREARSMLGI